MMIWLLFVVALAAAGPCESPWEARWPRELRKALRERHPDARRMAIDALRTAPDDGVAWVALALVSRTPTERRWAVDEAAARAPLHAAVQLARADLATADGDEVEAQRLLDAARADPGAAFAVAWSEARRQSGPDGLRALNARCPDRADIALELVERVEPTEALTILHVGGTSPTGEHALRAALLAGRPQLAASATAELGNPWWLDPQLPRWTSCLVEGSASPEELRAAWTSIGRAWAVPGPPPAAPSVPAAPECAAAWVALAGHAGTDCQGRVRALREALHLRPDDRDLHRQLGAALVDAGQPTAALAWLKPDDPPATLELARARLALGEADTARTLLEQAPPTGIDLVAWFTMKAEAAATPSERLSVLVQGADQTWDRELARRARRLASELSAPARALDTLLEFLGVDFDAEILVVDEGVQGALDRVIAQLRELGYDAPIRKGGTLTFRGSGLGRPKVKLFEDGTFDIRAAAVTLRQHGGDGLPVASRRKILAAERRTHDALRDSLSAWQRATQQRATLEALPRRLARQLEAIWHDGASPSGRLRTPELRRRALVELWRTRECSPAGEAARTQIERYLRWVVGSTHPVTDDELVEVNAERPCGQRLEP